MNALIAAQHSDNTSVSEDNEELDDGNQIFGSAYSAVQMWYISPSPGMRGMLWAIHRCGSEWLPEQSF